MSITDSAAMTCDESSSGNRLSNHCLKHCLNHNSNRGFTLIEMLLVVAIIMILAGLSVTAFTLYREQAYARMGEQLLSNARTALEAGKQDEEDFPSALMRVDVTAAGALPVGVGKQLFPGLVLPNDLHFFATHNPTCAADACLQDYIEARSCKINIKSVWFRTYGGVEVTNLKTAEAAACS